MNPWRKLQRALRGLFQKRTLDAEMEEEMRSHIEMRMQEKIAAGMKPDEARYAALRQFGWVESTKERCREQRGLNWIEGLVHDLRYGARMLWKRPGMTLVAALTFALGIGVNTSMFSLLNPLLVHRVPCPKPEELVRVYRISPQSQDSNHSLADFLDHREQNHVFEPLAAYHAEGANLGADGQAAERVTAIHATERFFEMLGIHPTLGRVFTAEESLPGHDRVAVLSHRFWTSQFAGDTNIVGRAMRLDGEPCVVIGVMPATFEFPVLWGEPELWRPFVIKSEEREDRDNRYLSVIGRLKSGVCLAQAQSEMTLIATRLQQDHPHYAAGSGLRLMTLEDSFRPAGGRRSTFFLLGLTSCILLIACANLANLQLASLNGRSRELTVRAALGARRQRLVRQLLTESILISLLGGILGLVFASFCNEILSKQFGTGLNAVLEFHVIAFALICCLLITIAFGTVPAWFAAHVDINETLKESVRGATGSRSQRRLQNLLIITEIALTLMLLTGAGTTIRLLQRFTGLDPGWRVDGLLTADVALPRNKYPSPEQRNAFWTQLEERLGALPGVERAAFSDDLPITSFWNTRPLRIEDRVAPLPGAAPLVSCPTVSPAFFQTLGIDLLQGRFFESGDKLGRPTVAIINRTMGRHFWPDQSPVGKRISIGDPANPQWMEIVGVVGDVGFPADAGVPDTRWQVYRPKGQDEIGTGAMVIVRTSAASGPTADALRRAVSELDPDLPVYSVTTVRQSIDGRMRSNYLILALLGAFGMLGLILAAIGVFGVTSYATVRRTREIGIRMAFGAQARTILTLFLYQGVRPGLIGAALGLGGSIAVMRFLDSLIPSGSPMRDPATLAGLPISGWAVALNAAFVLVVVTLLASYLPARRAAKVDPIRALSYE
jgi:putative ABC transport system permease protein